MQLIWFSYEMMRFYQLQLGHKRNVTMNSIYALRLSCFSVISSNYPNTIMSISLSTVWMMIFFILLSASCKWCITNLVSASSSLQMSIELVLVTETLEMLFHFVIWTFFFPNWYLETAFVRKSNNSILVLEFRRKSS